LDGEGGIKENGGGDEFKCDIRTFVNTTVNLYPSTTVKLRKEIYFKRYCHCLEKFSNFLSLNCY
jgi:hypothetical protein